MNIRFIVLNTSVFSFPCTISAIVGGLYVCVYIYINKYDGRTHKPGLPHTHINTIYQNINCAGTYKHLMKVIFYLLFFSRVVGQNNRLSEMSGIGDKNIYIYNYLKKYTSDDFNVIYHQNWSKHISS